MDSKYDLHPDLDKYEKLRTDVIPSLIPTCQKIMDVLYRLEKSDDKVSVYTIEIPSFDKHLLRVLVYSPKKINKVTPAMIFYHGGGWCMQAGPHHFKMARKFCEILGCKVFFIDYRLAPKYKYPFAPQDCFSAYRWIRFNAEELNINPDEIILCGDSAGGNLAIVTNLMAKDFGFPASAGQILLYPVVSHRMNTQSMKEFTDVPVAKTENIKKYFEIYLGDVEINDYSYISPLEVNSLLGMPPTYIEVAEFDCLRDEGIKMFEKLKNNHNNAKLNFVKGAMHGCDVEIESDLVKECFNQRIKFINKILDE